MLIATVFRHCVRAFILYSSTFLVACMDGWMVPLFSAYYPLLFQHFFFYYALLLYSSTAWVLCYCVPAIAFQHYFILCVFPLRVLILFLATSIFSMRISIVLQHFFVRACLMMIKLLLHFLLHFGSNSFKNKRHGPIRNPFDKMPPDFKTSWRDLYDEICSIGPNIERIMSIFSLWDPCAS